MLGVIIRFHRTNAGMTQGELAARSELSASEISALERGVRSPKLSTIHRLSLGLRVSPAALYDRISWDVDEKRFEIDADKLRMYSGGQEAGTDAAQ